MLCHPPQKTNASLDFEKNGGKVIMFATNQTNNAKVYGRKNH